MSEQKEIHEIQILPEGLFRVQYQKLSLRTIRNLRTRWENKVLELHRQKKRLKNQIAKIDNQISQLEDSSKTLREWSLEHDEEYKKEHKAQQFLESYIGHDAFIELRIEKEITFKARDERTYKIDVQGNVFRKSGTSFRRLCIIKPRNMPLSDQIASILTSIKEHPDHYRLRQQRG